jgi:hypothetical protein
MKASTTPTLDAFTDWVSEIHGATFDAMDTTEGDAYRAHLASFARTNTALQLLTQFKEAHPTSPSADSGDSEPLSLLVEVNERRRMVCLQATWEIDAIARALPGLVPDGDEESPEHSGAPRFLVRAMAGRMLRLTHVLMGALGDFIDTTEDLERIVTLNGGQG